MRQSVGWWSSLIEGTLQRSGLNISTSEVESVVATLADVADVCVCGVPDATRDECVAAVIVREPESDLTIDSIRSHCQANLAPHKVPERIEFCEALPRTSVGKIRKTWFVNNYSTSIPSM